MKIIKLKLSNFRGYSDEISIDINDLTVLVGKNDIGKSTILEALDIFFNEGKGVAKLDINDICKTSPNKGFTIAVTFEDLPDEIIIDEDHKTNLKDEYLVDKKGNLEIIKKFYSGKKNTTVYVNCYHPTHPKCGDLLEKKQKDLNTLISNNNIDTQYCDKRINTHLRKAIWNHFRDELNLQERELEVGKEDTKNIWDKLQRYLPKYYLFQADRKNFDSDNEVQDPLKLVVSQILGEPEVLEQLSSIYMIVNKKLQEFSNLTLDELRTIDENLANSLKPNLPTCESLKWGDTFKNVSICSDDDIPINKRGSGVRRLILLSFFKAQIAYKGHQSPVIYAIEEPETSQHFCNQRLLTDALKQLSNKGNTQVILTTHSSVVIKELDLDNVVMITNENGKKVVKRPEPTCTKNVSLNEIAYLALGEISPEYHSELYEEILYLERHKFKRTQWNLDREYFVIEKGENLTSPYKQEENKATIHTFIRNQNHHSKENGKAALEDMANSIIALRKYLLDEIECKNNS